MTSTFTPDSNHEEKLLPLFGQIVAAVMQRGLTYAQRDDPHTFGSAAHWMATPGNRFQLRIDWSEDGAALTTRGLVVDSAGDALVEVFTISAAAGNSGH
jgi:hypothetical protein